MVVCDVVSDACHVKAVQVVGLKRFFCVLEMKQPTRFGALENVSFKKLKFKFQLHWPLFAVTAMLVARHPPDTADPTPKR